MCIFSAIEVLVTFTLMLIGVYQVASKYKLSTMLIILLFLASFLKYLDLPPGSFNYALIFLLQGFELFLPFSFIMGIYIDMNKDPWKYRLDREQYRDSFMGRAYIYWHIRNNFPLVAKLSSLILMQLGSAGGVFLIVTNVLVCPGAAVLAILIIIFSFIALILIPQILEKGYESLQYRGNIQI